MINVKKLIDRVRTEITMDTDASDYRWTTAVMTDFVRQTVYELLRIRKHLLLTSKGEPSQSDDFFVDWKDRSVENGTATIPIPERYTEALMSGVAMRCFLMDAADQNNAARASYERNRFYELVGAPVAAATTA